MPAGIAGAEDHLKLLDATAAAGGRMFGQTHTRGVSHVLSFKSQLQFDDFPEWAELRKQPIEEQRRALKDPERRKRLVEATRADGYKTGGGEPRKPTYENMPRARYAWNARCTKASSANSGSRLKTF